jgi:hypothetical protein
MQNEFSEGVSKPLTQPLTLGSYHNRDDGPFSLFTVQLIYYSVVDLPNMAKQRKSRADNAQVRSIIELLNSISTIKRTSVRNITRKLTPTQYEQLLRVIEDSNDNRISAEVKDKLR